MRIRFLGGFVVLAAAALAAGCFSPMHAAPLLGVGLGAPRPNVMVAPDKTPAALVLAAGIADSFVIQATGSVHEVPVRAWRQTLEAGFHSAFPSGSAERKLELLNADLAFSPAAVSHGATAAVVATIRFKARVLDASDKPLAAIAGTVEAREAAVTPSEAAMTDNASKAVEALYEKLTAELLAKN